MSKAKAAKLVRTLVDLLLDMEAGTGKEVELCQECIDWAKDEKRTFLRQALEVSDAGSSVLYGFSVFETDFQKCTTKSHPQTTLSSRRYRSYP